MSSQVAERPALKETNELRKAAGRWLRGLREAQSLSQRELAQHVGVEYYTFVSQLETGRGRINPDQYLIWAKILQVEPKVFARTLLRYYEPTTYQLLFPQDSTP